MLDGLYHYCNTVLTSTINVGGNGYNSITIIALFLMDRRACGKTLSCVTVLHMVCLNVWGACVDCSVGT